MACISPCIGYLHPIKFVPRCLTFIKTTVNGIVFLYSFSICSLFVYRKVTDFCKLMLYPATLLKLSMVSRSSWVEFLGSLSYKIFSSANRDTLTISLPICIPFISSSCLTLYLGIPGICWVGVWKVGTLWLCAVESVLLSDCLFFSYSLILPVLLWFCLLSSSVWRIPCRIFCSGGLVVIYVSVSAYRGRLLFLHQFWMIILLGKVL
jgi:hypothetical protein